MGTVPQARLLRGLMVVCFCGFIAVGCGSGGGSEQSANDEAGGSEGGGEFRLGKAGYENTCSVLTEDEVSEASGLTVTGSEEVGGCNWLVERVDETVIADDSIGWQPMQAAQFEAQREAAPQMGADLVIEPIEGIGKDAYWQGTADGPVGEVWVLLDDFSFRVINQFSGSTYEGSREHQVGLATALAEKLG